MTLGIMQPYLFPYLGYFQLINAVDKFIILDDVNYINRGWINRNRIEVNGREQMFTVPLKSASQNKLINEIEVLQNNVRKTIEMAYHKSPYFKEVYPLINLDGILISDIAVCNIKAICKYLGIETLIENVNVSKVNTGQYRILDICKQHGADHYINPMGGKDLYSKELFAGHGIALNFIQTKPSLSIIHILMTNSREAVREMLKDYELS